MHEQVAPGRTGEPRPGVQAPLPSLHPEGQVPPVSSREVLGGSPVGLALFHPVEMHSRATSHRSCSRVFSSPDGSS